jgi:hypothetical protein
VGAPTADRCDNPAVTQIDWSNPTVQGALIASLISLVGLIGAGLAGFLAAVLGAHIGATAARHAADVAQREAEADREDARQSRLADRVEAHQSRFADRKLSLAVELLLAADAHTTEASEQVRVKLEDARVRSEYGVDDTDMTIPAVGSPDLVRRAYQALDLVSPGTADAARELYLATLPLGQLAARWRDPEGDDKQWSRDWQRATDRWDDARHGFVDSVRIDLGVSPDGARTHQGTRPPAS